MVFTPLAHSGSDAPWLAPGPCKCPPRVAAPPAEAAVTPPRPCTLTQDEGLTTDAYRAATACDTVCELHGHRRFVRSIIWGVCRAWRLDEP